MLAAALGGRQLSRPEQLNVARRTLAFSLRGWHGSRGRQQHLFVHDGGVASRRSHSGPEQRRGEAPALDAEDLVSYRRLAAREDPFGLATWRRKLANRDNDGAKR